MGAMLRLSRVPSQLNEIVILRYYTAVLHPILSRAALAEEILGVEINLSKFVIHLVKPKPMVKCAMCSYTN